ncbi:hypothetical protein AAE478_005548 [Parahypoxylon ruwenzoriense]
MNSIICSRCRAALRRSLRAGRAHQSRASSTAQNSNLSTISTVLAKPSWSVRSLLPTSSSSSPASPPSDSTTTIAPQTLQHLLRLSALPQPSSPEEEARMLSTLESQLHFVRAVREVDTAGVEPLRAIRDETAQGMREQTIGLEQLKDVLAREDVVGHARRPRRRRQEQNIDPAVEGWDVLCGASEVAGRYFVVRTGRSSSPAKPSSQVGDTTKESE